MAITKVTEIHEFINLKDKKTCKVISTRLKNENFSVTFRGWNPFPCFSMETSWNALRKWMTDNSWIELAGVTRNIVIEKEAHAK